MIPTCTCPACQARDVAMRAWLRTGASSPDLQLDSRPPECMVVRLKLIPAIRPRYEQPSPELLAAVEAATRRAIADRPYR